MRKYVFHIVQQAMMGIINVESSCHLKTCESLQNIRKKLHSVIKTFSKMSNYCAQIRRQTQQAFFVCVAILILQLESEDAILQPPFAPRFPDKPSQRRDANHSAGSTESRHLTRDVNALKKPPCTLSRWFFHGLVVLSSLFSPALDRCQRHSNVSGCVTVLSRRHFVDESVQASSFSFLQDWWSAAHTLSGGRLFLGGPALIVF